MSCTSPQPVVGGVMWLPREAEPVVDAASIRPSATFFAASLVDHIIFLSLPFSTIVWHDVGTPSPSQEDEANPPSSLRLSSIVRWGSSTISFIFSDQNDSFRTIRSPRIEGRTMLENRELIP